MAGEITPTDSRLFLFRSLDYGVKSGLMASGAIKQLERDGAALSFGFAKKYYRVVYEAYLRQASFCVLGIINLGLEATAKGDMQKAAILVEREGVVTIFRHGWTRLLKLAQLIKRADGSDSRSQIELERDLAEWLSAEPDKPWNGVREFVTSVRKYGALARQCLADEKELALQNNNDSSTRLNGYSTDDRA